MGPQLLQLPVPAHQGDDGLDVITLHRVVGDLVGPDESAGDAAVDEHETFATAMFDMLGTHHPLACRGPVAGVDVEMLGAQARRAVVPIAPIAQRDNARPAVLAGEALVLGGSADGSASGSKKGIFNRECRVPFASHCPSAVRGRAVPRLVAGEGPVHRLFPLVRGRRLLPLPASPGRLSAAGSGPRPGLHGLSRSLSAEPPQLPAVGVVPLSLASASSPGSERGRGRPAWSVHHPSSHPLQTVFADQSMWWAATTTRFPPVGLR